MTNGYICEVCGDDCDGKPADVWIGSPAGMGICAGCAANDPRNDDDAAAWVPFRIVFVWPNGETEMRAVKFPPNDNDGAKYWAAGFARSSGAVTWRIYDSMARRVG